MLPLITPIRDLVNLFAIFSVINLSGCASLLAKPAKIMIGTLLCRTSRSPRLHSGISTILAAVGLVGKDAMGNPQNPLGKNRENHDSIATWDIGKIVGINGWNPARSELRCIQ